MAAFENPINQHRVSVDTLMAFLGCLFFGFIYFLFKGSYKHMLLNLVASFLTMGLAWLIYPFFAPSIIRNMYLEKGYKQV
jgi:hypothetical protein